MLSNGKKNILIITDVLKIMAGSEKNITQLVMHVNKDRFRFFIACFIPGPLAEDMIRSGFSVYTLYGAGVHTYRGLKNLVFLLKLVRENDISLIITYHEGSDPYGLIISKISGVPVISSRRDMGFKAHTRHRMVYRLFGRFFNVVIAVSHGVEREVVRKGWFPKNRVVTIYNGVQLKDYVNGQNVDEIKRNIGINRDQPVVGMIANLRRIKGVRWLIEAASIISEQNPEVEFLIVGDDLNEPGCTRKDMESIANRLNVRRKVHFMGKRNDVRDLISVFDVAVVPSLSEGFSNTILEYMASSKPVVATDVGGNREGVLHGETGLLVPPEDSHALAQAIMTVLEDKDLALRFGRAGRRRVEENFSLEKMVTNYEHFFEQIIACKKNNCSFRNASWFSKTTE
jgi:glycosyltransferase involved in cell wall biosynthesis